MGNGGSLDGTRILQSETVDLMTSRQRVGAFDQTLQHVVDFGLGVIVDSNRYGAETVPYGYSRYCSERTFGHGGSQSSIGFAIRNTDSWSAMSKIAASVSRGIRSDIARL